MYNFDSIILNKFIEENKDFFLGARIQKIQQPTRREFLLSIHNRGESKKLYININPNCYHVCFMSKENESKRYIEIPKAPPMFCMLLRKYLEGAKISKVEQPENERILELYVEAYNELKEKIYLCLAVELMGKHSNVVLYSYDTNVIIGCAHNVGSEKSREREMAGTLPYVYPSQSSLVRDLSQMKTFYNMIYDGAKTVNQTLDDYYAEFQSEDKLKMLKVKLTTIVSNKLKKVKTSLLKMEKQIEREKSADKYRIYGDLIMANLYNNKDFSKFIEVYNYDGELIKIELDEIKTLKENANRFYKMYRKAKTSSEKLSELSQGLIQEKSYFEDVLYSIDASQTVEELIDIKQEIEPIKDNKKEKKDKSLNILELEIDGHQVFVGKNNKQNDYIVSKLAKSEDYWFHVKDCAGSHVLLKAVEPKDELILACAKLAKDNSVAKNSLKSPVIYVQRKYIKKPPAAKLGYVIFTHEKELMITS